MRFSLILTSADRVSDLRRFMGALLQQVSGVHIQLIFINQGVYNPCEEFRLGEIYEYTTVNTGRIPLSKARNIGLNKASEEIVAFPDDDCWYEPHLLQKINNFFSSNPDVDCVCTNVYDPIRRMPYGGRPVGVRCRIGFGNVFRLPISVGLFVRRSALERAGAYFDESLGAGTVLGSGEETEFISRLLRTGARVEYVGSIQVFHPVTDYTESDVAKYYKYGLGFGYLNGRLVRQGHLGVAGHFSNVFVRSLGGAIINASTPVRRRLYWNRLAGIVKGFMQGLGA